MMTQILQDLSTTGKERPWKEHKMNNELLSLAYEDVDPRKAERLRDCATKLTFEVKEDGSKKLVGSWFCRVRLCPVCTWRRSLKVAAQMTKIMDAMGEQEKWAYVLLTLTVRNCTPDELENAVTGLLDGYNRMMQLSRVKHAVSGWYRSMEITHNMEADTYHPHIHVVLAVRPGYFSGGRYIKQAEWTSLWKQSLRVDYDPIVDVRRIKGNTTAAVAEVAKYSVKASDYIVPDDWDMTVETVRLLDRVLHKRRLVAFGGVFREYHRALNLEEPESGDLVNTSGAPAENIQRKIVSFVWYSGYRQYQQSDGH